MVYKFTSVRDGDEGGREGGDERAARIISLKNHHLGQNPSEGDVEKVN